MVTLKDILRLTTQTIQQATSTSDGQSTLDIIEQYLNEQKLTNATPSDGATIDKLSSELVTLCSSQVLQHPLQKTVSCKPEAGRVHNQHYLILCIVRQLLPIFGPSRIFQDWWEPILKPILSTASYSDQIKKEARAIMSESLTLELQQYDEATFNGTEAKYFCQTMECYLDWVGCYREHEELQLPVDSTKKIDDIGLLHHQHNALMDLDQEEWAKNLKTILLNVGGTEPKRFFVILNIYFLVSKHRSQIVYMLNEFIRCKRTHFHVILETDLLASMLKSLMFDNSTTLVALSVSTMIMLLPRICTTLAPYLPQLCYIFARSLCWDQLRDMRRQNHDISSSTAPATAAGWDCVDYTFSKLAAPPSNQQAGPLFTALYGLYPCNFIKFLHDPYDYFEQNNFDVPEEFDEETFRTRAMSQVARHMLHPNLVVQDAETELKDLSRLLKLEPPDVIAQIMSLDLTNAALRSAFGDDTEHSRNQKQELLEERVLSKIDSDPQPSPASELTSSPLKAREPSAPILSSSSIMSNILDVHRELKSGARVIGDDVWDAGFGASGSTQMTANNSSNIQDSAALDDILNTHALTPVEEPVSPQTQLLISALRREVILLRNELNFELFVKQQHLQHIGRLHRLNILDSSAEADHQVLYIKMRTLMTQLKQTAEALEKIKDESTRSKQRHIKWEDEQSNKLRQYRESEKVMENEMQQVQQELAVCHQELENQSAKLHESRQRVFELENELCSVQTIVDKATENEHRVKQLTQQILLWEKNNAHLKEQKQYINSLLSRWWSMEELVSSLQSQNKRLTEMESRYEAELSHLQWQVQEDKTERGQRRTSLGDDMGQQDADGTKFTQLHETIDTLRRRLEELEMDKLALQAKVEIVEHSSRVSNQASK